MMIFKLRWVMLLGLCIFTKSYALPSPEEESAFIKKIHDSMQHMSELSIWPQNDIHLKPTLLHFTNHHSYAIQFQPTNPHWQLLSEFSSFVYFLETDEYQLDKVPLSYGNVIDGQSPCYIYQYIEGKGERNSFVALHERFHSFQGEHDEFRFFNFGIYKDLTNLTNMALSYLELSAIEDYWLNNQEESLKDYIAITQFRGQSLSKESINYEIGKEVWEGLADYFSIAALPDEHSIKQQLLQQDRCSKDFEENISCQRQWRYYYTGAIAAFALDNLSITDWKQKFIEQHLAPRIQLQQLFKMDKNEINQRVESAKERFYFNKSELQIQLILNDYLKKMNQHLQNYKNQEGTPLAILPGFKLTSSSSKTVSEQDYFIDSDQELKIKVTSIQITPDKRYTMEITELPYLLSSSTSTQLKLKPKTKIKIDGKSVNIEELVKSDQVINFRSLLISNPNFMLQLINLEGLVESKDGAITIKPKQGSGTVAGEWGSGR